MAMSEPKRLMTPLSPERRAQIERLSRRPGASEAVTHCPEWLSTFAEIREREASRKEARRAIRRKRLARLIHADRIKRDRGQQREEKKTLRG